LIYTSILNKNEEVPKIILFYISHSSML